MKKILLGTLVLGLGFLNAGMFSTVSGFTMSEIKPLSTYTLDTAGTNPRIYEFIPKNNKSILCIVLFKDGDRTSPTMQCVPNIKKRK